MGTTTMAGGDLHHAALYRLPWSVTDNVISWLEPTKQCNIYCEGCYSNNVHDSHKSLEEVRRDLDTFLRLRRTDSVSIAGGDPLTHPNIVDIVRMVSERGVKPVLNTNGVALTPECLRDLKKAGLKGFTFHVDSHQRRPGWKRKTEVELNELRLQFAEMVASVGGISCAFNCTVYEDTLPEIPDLLEWGRRHIDIVHVMVFILFRAAIVEGFEYFAGEDRIDIGELVYTKARPQRTDLRAPEVVRTIREREPEFAPCAYLNGTERPDSFKWLLTLRIGDRDGIVGYAGPRFLELSQTIHHLWTGRYLGYISPRLHAAARWALTLAGIDPGLARTLRRELGTIVRKPWRLFRPLRFQSVMIIQPVDVQADGRQCMCDGCPDMTVHQGQLVWSCRLEERLRFGHLMRIVPTQEAKRQEDVLVDT